MRCYDRNKCISTHTVGLFLQPLLDYEMRLHFFQKSALLLKV